MTVTRREFLRLGGASLAGAGMLGLAGCGGGQGSATTATTGGGGGGQEQGTVRVGYIPSAVAVHLWLAQGMGYFEEEGLQLEISPFDTGISLGNALSGGSLDVGLLGSVIANFPARGQGTAFCPNNVETNTNQLWVASDSGIESVQDLAGKRVATTTGTTAQLFLHTALTENGVDPNSVEIVNSEMPGAVNSFITGSTPAVALWKPFDKQVEEERPEAVRIDNLSNYYPDELSVVAGWVANNDYYQNSPDVLRTFTQAWMKANADLNNNREEAINTAYERSQELDAIPLSQQEFTDIMDALRFFSNERWAELYSNGTALEWIGQMEQTFVDIGGLDEFVEPEEFFATDIYLETYRATRGGSTTTQ